MLFAKAIPFVVGNANPPAVNIGEMKNTGFDLNINYANKAMNGDLKYSLGLVVSHYKNIVESISDSPTEFIAGTAFRDMVYTRATAGTAYPEFYGLIVDGIFNTQAEADAYFPEYGGGYNLPGHFKYRDVNGDKVIDDNDRTFIGSPHPKFTAGFNVDLTYKAFSLNAFLYASKGNKIANYTKRWIDYGILGSNLSTNALYNSWGSPYLANNADAALPMVDNDEISQYPSTAFIEDGSFLRLKTLQLTYTLPKRFCEKLAVSTLKFYVQGSNLFTITNYTGWDPEVVSRGIDKGVDTAQWPTTKQFTFGLNLDF
jgi:hypothetical protein